MDIQTKDGILLRNIPEGTPDEAIKARIAKIRAGKEPAFEREARELMQSRGPTVMGMELPGPDVISANPIVRTLTSAVRPIMGSADVLTGGANQERIRELDQMQARGAKALGYGGLETGAADFAGALLSPISGLAMKAEQAVSLLGKMAQGGGFGALAGLTSGSDRPLRAGATGAAVGGVIPAITTVATAPFKLVYDALTRKGGAYLEAAGDRAGDVARLASQNEQIVPGARPTVGEATVGAVRPELAALQEKVRSMNPAAFEQRLQEQNAARLAAVRSVGQTPEALAAAEAARKAAADPLYAAARSGKAPVDTAPLVSKVSGILEKNPGNRELVTELANVRSGLKAAGADPQKVASVLDGLKTSIADEKNKFIRGVLTEVKDDIANAIPGYQQAQRKFAEMSPPVNQMQVGQELERRLTPALSEEAKQRASVFASAVRESPQMLKKATGQPRFKNLEGVLNPEQLAAVNAVKEDLARGARFEDLARKGSSAAPAPSVDTKIPGFLERGIYIANNIISRVEGRINKKLAAEMAAELLNPPEFAKSLEAAHRRQVRVDMLAAAIERSRQVGVPAGVQLGTRD